jgi:hypothetical protein
LLLLLLLLVGCGESDPAEIYGGVDGHTIATLISEVASRADSPQRTAEIYAAGAAPTGTALKRYLRYDYRLIGRPSVHGETGTATIVFEEPNTGEQVGEKTWEFVKEGGTWKIKAAPLP